jgi:hypothetical protein
MTGLKLLNQKEGGVLEKSELHEKLARGALNISLSGVDDVERTLAVSQKTAELLLETLREAGAP